MKKKGKIFVLSGPSGSGKTTLHQKLLESPKVKPLLIKSISATTRLPRELEEHGKDYLFISRKMFEYKRRMGHFLESQKVFDNYYGTPLKNVRDILKTGKNVLLCIDVKGARVVRRRFPKAVTIFIKAPSLQALKVRLKGRASENPTTFELRLKVAKEELKEANQYQYVVVNRNLAKSVDKLEEIVLSEMIEEDCE